MKPPPYLAFDTNVLVDALTARHPFAAEALALFDAVETKRLRGAVAACLLPTLHYLVARERSRLGADHDLRDIVALFEVLPLLEADVHRAVAAPGTDFEDALIAQSCAQAGVDGIVTRDASGFGGSPVPPLSPAEALALLAP